MKTVDSDPGSGGKRQVVIIKVPSSGPINTDVASSSFTNSFQENFPYKAHSEDTQQNCKSTANKTVSRKVSLPPNRKMFIELQLPNTNSSTSVQPDSSSSSITTQTREPLESHPRKIKLTSVAGNERDVKQILEAQFKHIETILDTRLPLSRTSKSPSPSSKENNNFSTVVAKSEIHTGVPAEKPPPDGDHLHTPMNEPTSFEDFHSMGLYQERGRSEADMTTVGADEDLQLSSGTDFRSSHTNSPPSTPITVGGLSLLSDVESAKDIDKAIQKTLAHHSPDVQETEDENPVTINSDLKSQESTGPHVNEGGVLRRIIQHTCHYLHFALATPSIVRIPHLAHKYASGNGSAFIFAYSLCILLVAVPICFLEITMAQFSSLGPINIYGRSLPLLAGVGYGMVLTCSILMLLSSTWTSWSFFYLIHSLESQLPWAHCPSNNTPGCKELQYQESNLTDHFTTVAYMPSDYYFQMNVIKVLKVEEGNSGTFNISILGFQLMVWALIVFFLSRHEAWKQRWFSWISASFVFIILMALMIGGLSLSDSGRGLSQIFRLNFASDELADPEIWLDSLGQIFWSLGPAIGLLINRSSYHNFHQKISRDVTLSVLANLAVTALLLLVVFSYVGHIYLDEDINNSLGYFFVIITYSVTLGSAQNFCSVLVFICVCKCLLSHTVMLADTVATSLSDTLPVSWRGGRRRFSLEIIICIFGFTLSLPLLTKEGIYFMATLDALIPWVSGTVLGLLEVTFLTHVYKVSRIQNHFLKMQESRTTSYPLVSKYFTPLVLMGFLIWAAVAGVPDPISWDHVETAREDSYYVYGVVMSVIPLCVAVIVLVIQVVQYRENLKSLITPSSQWGTAFSRHKRLYHMNGIHHNIPWLAVQVDKDGEIFPTNLTTWIPFGYSWVPKGPGDRLLKERHPDISTTRRQNLAKQLQYHLWKDHKYLILNPPNLNSQRNPAYVVTEIEDETAVDNSDPDKLSGEATKNSKFN